ncbi:MAG TPA: hypothetical protein PLH37_03285 [bacterium]|mgnify:CR=1 FL=1|nr:hypothetical protein [bacterium]
MKGGAYAKVGNKNGKPGYRTQASFRLRAYKSGLQAKNDLKTTAFKWRVDKSE